VIPAGQAGALLILPGRADDMRAEIAVRIMAGDVAGDVAGDWGPLAIVGTLIGPRRNRDTTLPTTVRLMNSGCKVAGQADGRAVFTEPAYWTPELPNLYRLEARLLAGEQTLATVDRMVGLRRLGVRGRSLWLDGRRFVPRGLAAVAGFDPQTFRAAHVAAVIVDPPLVDCAAADRAGVAIVARLEDAEGRPLDQNRAAERIAAWSLHPAVLLAVVPRTAAVELAAAVAVATRRLKGTMVLALEADGTQSPDLLPADLTQLIDCIIVDLPAGNLPHEAWRNWPQPIPLVAQRPAALKGANSRGECDRLQADLAAWGLAGGALGFTAGVGRLAHPLPRDWAGYLVTAW